MFETQQYFKTRGVVFGRIRLYQPANHVLKPCNSLTKPQQYFNTRGVVFGGIRLYQPANHVLKPCNSNKTQQYLNTRGVVFGRIRLYQSANHVETQQYFKTKGLSLLGLGYTSLQIMFTDRPMDRVAVQI